MSNLITLQKAIDMTTLYRNERADLINPAIGDKDVLPFSETFGREAFDDLLAQNGCVGVRVYLGMDSNNHVRAIFVGVDDNDEDILTTGDEIIVEDGNTCPPLCPASSPLNS